jgi:hypothetical protein
MKFQASVVASILALSLGASHAFAPPNQNGRTSLSVVKSMAVEDKATSTTTETAFDSLTVDLISKLRFRDAQRELEQRDLDTTGTLSAMRDRLRQVAGGKDYAMQTAHDSIYVIEEETMNKVSDARD